MTTDDLIPDEFHGRHPGTKANLRPFAYAHLSEHLQTFSRPFAELAYAMTRRLPDDPELAAGLRDLRRSKDCMVSCAVFNPMTAFALDDENTMAAATEADADVTSVHPFKVGDKVRFNLLPEDIGREMAVTVTDVGVCDEDSFGEPCGEPTIHFTDRQTGQTDEAHASDFALVEGA